MSGGEPGPGAGRAAPPQAADAADYLVLEGISKTFPGGVVANRDISLTIRRGEVHALLGENGAGKSTLMKILDGFYRPDAGRIVLDGREQAITSPAHAKRLGIGMVFQQFMLIPNFTVVENVALALSGTGFWLRRGALAARIAALSERYGFGIDPHAPVWHLAVGDQQKVEILKPLLGGARLLIFDEPTSVLAPHEAEALFRVFDQLRADGYTILFITHKMREVLACADRISVLRRGRLVGTVARAEATADSLIALILGTPEDAGYAKPQRTGPIGGPLLELRGVTAGGDRGGLTLRGVDLTLRGGEILGVAGVSGNGQRELGEVVMGLRRCQRGHVLLDGAEVTNAAPSRMLAGGVACIPEDPLRMAVVPEMTVDANLALGAGDARAVRGWRPVRWGAVRAAVVAVAEGYGLRLPRLDVPAGTLSGGNVQRLVLAREMAAQPKVLLAYYPTHGLDVGATRTVHRMLCAARDAGSAVLLVSEDLEELTALGDRLAVMYHGRIAGLFTPPDVNLSEVGHLMTGGGVAPAAADVPAVPAAPRRAEVAV